MSWREIHAHLAAARDYARWAEVSVAALCEMPNAEACQRVIAEVCFMQMALRAALAGIEKQSADALHWMAVHHAVCGEGEA